MIHVDIIDEYIFKHPMADTKNQQFLILYETYFSLTCLETYFEEICDK